MAKRDATNDASKTLVLEGVGELHVGDYVELKGYHGPCGVHGQGKCGKSHIIAKMSWNGKGKGALTGGVLKNGRLDIEVVVMPLNVEAHWTVGEKYMFRKESWKSIRKIAESEALAYLI